MINNDRNWWISGGGWIDGFGGNGHTDSLLFDGSFTPFWSLVAGDFAHHMFAANDTHVIHLEGDANSGCRLFDLTTNTWHYLSTHPNVIQWFSEVPDQLGMAISSLIAGNTLL